MTYAQNLEHGSANPPADGRPLLSPAARATVDHHLSRIFDDPSRYMIRRVVTAAEGDVAERVLADPELVAYAAPEPADGYPAEIEHYAQGLDFAAEVMRAEARWQTELALRAGADDQMRGRHEYSADRALKCEAALRAVASTVRPPAGRPRS